MSDLAAPLLVVMRDEGEAFWAFVAIMARWGANFGPDLGGVGAQLGALRRLVQVGGRCRPGLGAGGRGRGGPLGVP